MERIKQKIGGYYDSTVNFFADTLTESSSKEGFFRYFRNTGWLFAGRMSGLIVSFFVGAYVARYLGPAQYGLLSYAVSFTGLFAVFASFGIDSILSRELVSNPEKKNELMGSGFFIKIIGSIFSIALIVITLFFLKADLLTNTLILISALSFIAGAFGIIDIYFQSQVLAKNTVRIQIISLIITTILKLLFIYLQLGLIYFISVYFIDGLIIAIGLIFTYKKRGLHITNWHIDKSIVSMLIRSSWPLILSGMAITVYLRIDQVMIKNILGNEVNGLYSVVVKLSEIWDFIPWIICTSIFPAIINAKTTSVGIYKKRLKSLYILFILISFSISIFIFLFSNPIIKILFGESYMGASSVLRIYVWSSIPIFLGMAVGNYLIAEDLIKINIWSTIGGAILNVILNIILIPRYGINGAAIATLISYSFVIILIVILIKNRKKLI